MRIGTFVYIKCLVVGVGVVLAILSELKSGELNVWHVLWSTFPYCTYYLAATKAESKSHGAVIGGGFLILGVDFATRIQVSFFPGSSTDSIALFMMPFWQTVLIMPLGFLLGWIVERAINKALSKR